VARASRTTNLTIESYVPYLVNRAAVAMLGYSAREFEKLGLTVPKWRILLALWNHDECRFGDLAQLTSIEPPTLSRFLNAMSAARLVARRRIESDSRSVSISLTAAGRALFEKTIPFAENVNRTYVKGLSAAELAVLRRALTTIHANVRAQEERERA
jgi:DNA-binding MarR family transcriptional regulator